MILVGILCVLVWFRAIFDITKSSFKNQTTKTIWFEAVFIFPFLASVVYFQLKRELSQNLII